MAVPADQYSQDGALSKLESEVCIVGAGSYRQGGEFRFDSFGTASGKPFLDASFDGNKIGGAIAHFKKNSSLYK